MEAVGITMDKGNIRKTSRVLNRRQAGEHGSSDVRSVHKQSTLTCITCFSTHKIEYEFNM